MKKAYIAAGWFSEEQEKARLEVLEACMYAGIKVYSPKDDLLYKPGITKPAVVFNANIRNILKCNCMIASTEGKDMGTLFECGFAFAMHIPIVYYYTGQGPFNIMLSESSLKVCKSATELRNFLKAIEDEFFIFKEPYKGDVE